MDQRGDTLEIPPTIGVVKFMYDRAGITLADRILPGR
jgi:hypothetical protein